MRLDASLTGLSLSSVSNCLKEGTLVVHSATEACPAPAELNVTEAWIFDDHGNRCSDEYYC